MLFPQCHIELPVRAKGDSHTLVATVVAGRECDDGCGLQRDAGTIRPAEHVLLRVIGVGVERIHSGLWEMTGSTPARAAPSRCNCGWALSSPLARWRRDEPHRSARL